MTALFSAVIMFIIVLYFASLTLFLKESEAVFLPRRLSPFLNAKEKILMEPKKRPFCNAFTGCGRKRSNIPALSSDGQEVDNSIDSLLELSAEPAVEELSRQIMSEAKLWEAIQEANLELNRQRELRHKQHESSSLNKAQTEEISPNSDRGAIGSCALPPCYIQT